jgi:hypothetical protein
MTTSDAVPGIVSALRLLGVIAIAAGFIPIGFDDEVSAGDVSLTFSAFASGIAFLILGSQLRKLHQIEAHFHAWRSARLNHYRPLYSQSVAEVLELWQKDPERESDDVERRDRKKGLSLAEKSAETTAGTGAGGDVHTHAGCNPTPPPKH